MERLRGFVLALVTLGVVGSGVELLLLDHDQEALQLIPLVLLTVALAVIGWHALRPSSSTVTAMRVIMSLLVLGGIMGIVLHFRGSLAFQLEMDPTASGWTLFKKAIRAQAPPALAPGLLTQLGLLGLTNTYRHPAIRPGDRRD